MNEQQQYEKHLAEKFQQLPLPDVEPNWQQMKSLLDKEMPRGGGYWRWRTAFGILLLMLGGTWLFISQTDPGSLVGVNKSKHLDSISKLAPPNTSDQSSFKTQDTENENLEGATSTLPQSATGQQQQDLKSKNIEENLLSKSQNTTRNNNLESSGNVKPETGTDNLARGTSTRENRRSDRKSPMAVTKKTTGSVTAGNNPTVANRDELISDESRPAPIQPIDVGLIRRKSSVTPDGNTTRNAIVNYDTRNVIPGFSVEALAGDSISRNYPFMFPDNNPANNDSRHLSGKTKSAKLSAIESVQNRTIAIGVSLPLGFPLGDQKPGAYNVNARPNTISDFLPVPHMQYHLNNKVYLQTELQLLNPQFIRPVLLFESKTDIPNSNTVYYNSIYARKLYYFNVPLGIHYSPFPHFYLGTGLQFSSFISGVASHEKTSYVVGSGTSSLVSQRYEKFRNDSISNQIDNSEFRLMLDANYYWKQFTVGLRYNQALSNYVSLRLNNVSPLLQDKNKSLQFYLRYNLWEDYKRRMKK